MHDGIGLKVDLSLAGEDCQHAVTDEALCTVTGCALGTDVCHLMLKTKVNMVQGQEDGPLMTTSKPYVLSLIEQKNLTKSVHKAIA